MKYFILSGSHRPNSQSVKVARYIEATIQRELDGATTYLLELAHANLPFWDEGMWSGAPKWKQVWGPIATELRSSAALVVVSPEWSGMVPAMVKNFFLLAGNAELAHKPGLIVGVSSTRGGAYPVAELRASSYKNNHLCYIPEHIIVRDAGQVLGDGEPASDADVYLRKRIAYAVRVLAAYASALIGVRESGVIDTKTYAFGM